MPRAVTRTYPAGRKMFFNPSDVTYLYIIHLDSLIWYLATKLHKTLIDSPELEVISIVQRANLLKFGLN